MGLQKEKINFILNGLSSLITVTLMQLRQLEVTQVFCFVLKLQPLRCLYVLFYRCYCIIILNSLPQSQPHLLPKTLLFPPPISHVSSINPSLTASLPHQLKLVSSTSVMAMYLPRFYHFLLQHFMVL